MPCNLEFSPGGERCELPPVIFISLGVPVRASPLAVAGQFGGGQCGEVSGKGVWGSLLHLSRLGRVPNTRGQGVAINSTFQASLFTTPTGGSQSTTPYALDSHGMVLVGDGFFEVISLFLASDRRKLDNHSFSGLC